jgi:hypothetical protein
VRRFLGGQPVLARPDPLGYRLVRFARRRATLVAAVVLALAAGAAWKLTRRAPHFSDSPLRFQLVSTFPGSHRQASFSPDGSSIAFVMEGRRWNATGLDQDAVWRRSGETNQRSEERAPAALVAGGRRHRLRRTGPGHLVGPSGGRRSAADSRRRLQREHLSRTAGGSSTRWTPTSGLPASTAAARAASATAPATRWRRSTPSSRARPRFSPDGREIVYFQDHDGPVYGDLWSAPLDGGKPTRLTFDDVNTSHPVWMPDGSGIVYSSARRGGLTLWFRPAAAASRAR